MKHIPRNKISINSNVSSSHVFYRIKNNDNWLLPLKEGIAQHGNRDRLTNEPTMVCSTCSPTGLGTVDTTASLHDWKFYKTDAESAFLQTETAARDAYVRSLMESTYKRNHLWLQTVASYGLVSANAKLQVRFDNCFLSLEWYNV